METNKGHYCYGCETFFHDSDPSVTKHKGCKGKKSLGICVDGKEFMKYPYACTFKNRTPNPGVCQIIEINFETERLEVSNGAVRLFPSFEDVEIFKIKEFGVGGYPRLKKVNWL